MPGKPSQSLHGEMGSLGKDVAQGISEARLAGHASPSMARAAAVRLKPSPSAPKV